MQGMRTRSKNYCKAVNGEGLCHLARLSTVWEGDGDDRPNVFLRQTLVRFVNPVFIHLIRIWKMSQLSNSNKASVWGLEMQPADLKINREIMLSGISVNDMMKKKEFKGFDLSVRQNVKHVTIKLALGSLEHFVFPSLLLLQKLCFQCHNSYFSKVILFTKCKQNTLLIPFCIGNRNFWQ